MASCWWSKRATECNQYGRPDGTQAPIGSTSSQDGVLAQSEMEQEQGKSAAAVLRWRCRNCTLSGYQKMTGWASQKNFLPNGCFSENDRGSFILYTQIVEHIPFRWMATGNFNLFLCIVVNWDCLMSLCRGLFPAKLIIGPEKLRSTRTVYMMQYLK